MSFATLTLPKICYMNSDTKTKPVTDKVKANMLAAVLSSLIKSSITAHCFSFIAILKPHTKIQSFGLTD